MQLVPGPGKDTWGEENKLVTPPSSLSPGSNWCLSILKFKNKNKHKNPESGSWGTANGSGGSTGREETNRRWPARPSARLIVFGLWHQQFPICLHCSNSALDKPRKQEVASWKEFAYDLKRSSRQTHGQALS